MGNVMINHWLAKFNPMTPADDVEYQYRLKCSRCGIDRRRTEDMAKEVLETHKENRRLYLELMAAAEGENNDS
jgi:hypothetical protein